MTWYEGFDINAFEEQERKMLELACYVISRERERVGKSFADSMGIVTEYRSFLTMNQVHHAVLIAQYSEEQMFKDTVAAGRNHYRELFGEA